MAGLVGQPIELVSDGVDAAANQLQQALAVKAQRGVMLDQEIALAEVDGRIKASALKRIGDSVSASPGEATAVIRQWMDG